MKLSASLLLAINSGTVFDVEPIKTRLQISLLADQWPISSEHQIENQLKPKVLKHHLLDVAHMSKLRHPELVSRIWTIQNSMNMLEWTATGILTINQSQHVAQKWKVDGKFSHRTLRTVLRRPNELPGVPVVDRSDLTPWKRAEII